MLLKVFIFLAIILVFNELVCAYIRLNEGRTLYDAALQRSRETGKPLIVIGNPTASWKNYLFGPSYGCGDLCIDIAGCKCPNLEKRTTPREALSTMKVMPADSAIIFESGTKHLVPGLENQMHRVGGNNVYTVNLKDTSLILFLSHYTGSVLT